MRYETPTENYFRLFHPRPRFKNDVESVLLFLCQRLASLGTLPADDFDAKLRNHIRTYPGNLNKTIKTVNNWRTEITSLFGLTELEGANTRPGRYSLMLAQNEDLIEFFRYFLFTFQYPGAHSKSKTVAEQIERGIRFHPAKFISELFHEGQRLVGPDKVFSLTSPELTALAFNDVRVTSGAKSAAEVAGELLKNRALRVDYNTEGDVVRYAQDILDYMVLADLLQKRPHPLSYVIKPQAAVVLAEFVRSAPLFEGYRDLYGRFALQASDVSDRRESWFRFVNAERPQEAFQGDILSLLADADPAAATPLDSLLEGVLHALQGTANDVGRIGEAIVMSHESNRLSRNMREDLAKRVAKIPDHLGVGYDVLSFDADQPPAQEDRKRHIEVKTTRSKQQITTSSFLLTPNEWGSARTLRDSYYVYRLIISEGSMKMFVIQDPYGQDQKGTLVMTPRDGAEINYTESAGHWEPLILELEE